MNIKNLTIQARENSERWFPQIHDGSIDLKVFYALGMAGEAGETANKVKKGMRGTPVPERELREEVVDTFIYCLLLANELGMDLEEEYKIKRDFNEGRWGG